MAAAGLVLFFPHFNSCLTHHPIPTSKHTPSQYYWSHSVSCSLQLFLLLHILQREADGAVNTMGHIYLVPAHHYMSQSPFLTALVSLLHPFLFYFSHRSPPRVQTLHEAVWLRTIARPLFSHSSLTSQKYPWTETSYQEQPSLAMFISHLYVCCHFDGSFVDDLLLSGWEREDKLRVCRVRELPLVLISSLLSSLQPQPLSALSLLAAVCQSVIVS